MKILFLSLLSLYLFGCATTPPAQQIIQAPVNDISLAEVEAGPTRFLQSMVRCGGEGLKCVRNRH